MLLRRLLVAQNRIHHCRQDVGGANITRPATLELERQLGFLGSLFILVFAPQKPGAFQMHGTVRRCSPQHFVEKVPLIFVAPCVFRKLANCKAAAASNSFNRRFTSRAFRKESSTCSTWSSGPLPCRSVCKSGHEPDHSIRAWPAPSAPPQYKRHNGMLGTPTERDSDVLRDRSETTRPPSLADRPLVNLQDQVGTVVVQETLASSRSRDAPSNRAPGRL